MMFFGGKTMVTCRLAMLLAERRWPQRELIQRTGLHHATVSRLYHDTWTELSRETVEQVCAALDVAPGDLFVWCDGTEEP
jgi:DNA-binding Xre family transcriptional regulator